MIQFTVNDMTCGHCAGRVTEAIKSIDVGAQVKIDLQTKIVAVESRASAEQLMAAVREAGYTATAG